MPVVQMVFPQLIPNLHGDYDFGAWKEPLTVKDPHGVSGTGIIHLRGAVRPDPLFHPPGHPTGEPYPIFNLPAGMRPARDRFLTYERAVMPGGRHDSRPAMLVVCANGDVELCEEDPCEDHAWFLDGVNFLAEDVKPRVRQGAAKRSPRARTRQRPERSPARRSTVRGRR